MKSSTKCILGIFLVLLIGLGIKISYSLDGYYSGSSSSCAMGVSTAVLHFETNGGESVDDFSISSKVVLDSSFPVPVREGYVFGGWYYDEELKEKVELDSMYDVEYTREYDEKGCTIPVHITFYALWLKKVESGFHTNRNCAMGIASRVIYYDSNGGNELEKFVASSKIIMDPKIPTPVKEKATFMGWYYDKEFTQKVETDNPYEITYTPQTDEYGCTIPDEVTIYAKWQEELVVDNPTKTCATDISPYKIVYNTNGGNLLSPYIQCSGCELKNTLLSVPKKNGYEFDGWYYDVNLTNKVTEKYANKIKYTEKRNDEGCLVQTNVVLYAKWIKIENENIPISENCPFGSPSFYIVYNTNGGENIDEYYHCITCTQEEIKIPIPKKIGYKFDGWYYDKGFTDKVTIDDLSLVTYEQLYKDGCPIWTEVNLYAKWSIESNKIEIDDKVDVKSVEIIYDTLDGNKIPNDIISSDSDGRSSLKIPEKQGYVFLGWYYDKDYTNKVEAKYLEDIINDSDSKTIQLYAKWEKEEKVNVFVIILIAFGFILISSVTVILIIKNRNKKVDEIEVLGL